MIPAKSAGKDGKYNMKKSWNNVYVFEYYNESDGYANIHVHFDCPLCGGEDIGTEYLSEYYGGDEFYADAEFYCRECLEKFITLAGDKILHIG